MYSNLDNYNSHQKDKHFHPTATHWPFSQNVVGSAFQTINRNAAILQPESLLWLPLHYNTTRTLRHGLKWSSPVTISSTCCSSPYSLGSTSSSLLPFSWTSYAFPNTGSCLKIAPVFEIVSFPSFIKITSTHPVHCGWYCKRAPSLVIKPVKSAIFGKSLKIIWKLNSNSNVSRRMNILIFCYKIQASFLTPHILL